MKILLILVLSTISLLATDFITSFDNTTVKRNNYPGQLGMQVVIGASPIYLSTLCRIFITGNTQTHTVYVYDSTPTVLASASVTGGTNDNFTCTATSTVTLNAGQTYYIGSDEFDTGDQWYDQTPVTYTAVATSVHSAYFDGTNWNLLDNDKAFVPVSFQYSTSPPVSTKPAHKVKYQ